MAKWLQPFFLLAAKLYMLLVLLRPSKIPLPPDAISPQLEPENICESILDFTARFGEIKPDMPNLCRRGRSGSERAVFASFPSVRKEMMKKSLNLRFLQEQVNHQPPKYYIIGNQNVIIMHQKIINLLVDF